MRVVAWPEWAELTFDGVYARVERIEDLDWDAALAPFTHGAPAV
jgi:hypothetical protein